MERVLKGRRTKRKLAAALKAQLERHGLDRVRVHDLTDPCEIHRQTFYYHFEDVYALFAWCAEEDGRAVSGAMLGQETWQGRLGVLLDFLGRDRGYILALLDSGGLWEAFCAQVLPLVTEGRGFGPVLLPLLEKWIRDNRPAEELTALLEGLPLTV